MLDKKQIQAIFLFEFKMGCKAVETTCNINNLARELLMNVQCSSGQGSFAKETKALNMSQLSEVDNNQLRAIIKGDALTTT